MVILAKIMNQADLRHIISLVAYFAVFDYPLTKKEIQHFLQFGDNTLDAPLQHLIDEGVLDECRGYVGYNLTDEMVTEREGGNQRAENLQAKAQKNARLIAKFPFVRGVLVSGSFSKGYVGEDGDIDYFIITSPGRLWIARTSLILYKKLFLLNSHEFFCVNYFVDECNLEIEEKNIFTATELITLLPMVNKDLYNELIQKNNWIKAYYPSLFHESPVVDEAKRSVMQRMSEKPLGGKMGNKLDSYLMKVTLKKWQKKFGFLSNEDFEVAMKTSTNVSKHHPNNFQRKVLEKYDSIHQSLIAKLEENNHVKAAV